MKQNNEQIDPIELEDIAHLNSSNLFLTLIEPKKIATQDMLEYLKEELDLENIKRKVYKVINSNSPREQALVLEEIRKKGEEEYMKETQRKIFESICQAKEKREMVFSNYYAFLGSIDNKLYDFALSKYFDENEYYINYACPFSEIFDENDWNFEYFQEEKMMLLAFSDEAVTLLEHFWYDYFEVIDPTAKRKILNLNKHA